MSWPTIVSLSSSTYGSLPWSSLNISAFIIYSFRCTVIFIYNKVFLVIWVFSMTSTTINISIWYKKLFIHFTIIGAVGCGAVGLEIFLWTCYDLNQASENVTLSTLTYGRHQSTAKKMNLITAMDTEEENNCLIFVLSLSTGPELQRSQLLCPSQGLSLGYSKHCFWRMEWTKLDVPNCYYTSVCPHNPLKISALDFFPLFFDELMIIVCKYFADFVIYCAILYILEKS